MFVIYYCDCVIKLGIVRKRRFGMFIYLKKWEMFEVMFVYYFDFFFIWVMDLLKLYI